jgi:NAD(P)-dependent dehydrogenase (short-subunit alcohol dehydrogenase family)
MDEMKDKVVVTHLHRSGGMDEAAYAAFLEHSKTTHPMRRVGQAEEVADLIYFLTSARAGWITGISCPIDGVMYHFPGNLKFPGKWSDRVA